MWEGRRQNYDREVHEEHTWLLQYNLNVTFIKQITR